MHKLLECDRDLSEMRNAGSDLTLMLERAFVLGRESMAEEEEEAAGDEQAVADEAAETQAPAKQAPAKKARKG